MEVDDATRIGIDEEVGNQRKEASQYDEVDLIVAHQLHHLLLVIQVGLGHHRRRHTQPLCPDEGISIGFVADHQGAIHLLITKIANQILTVRATS